MLHLRRALCRAATRADLRRPPGGTRAYSGTPGGAERGGALRSCSGSSLRGGLPAATADGALLGAALGAAPGTAVAATGCLALSLACRLGYICVQLSAWLRDRALQGLRGLWLHTQGVQLQSTLCTPALFPPCVPPPACRFPVVGRRCCVRVQARQILSQGLSGASPAPCGQIHQAEWPAVVLSGLAAPILGPLAALS